MPTDTEFIDPEDQEGPVEYKWTLANADADRIEHLSTQMRWRLNEGKGHALYRLGIEDNGKVTGMCPRDFGLTIKAFNKVVELSDAEKMGTYQLKISVPVSPDGKGKTKRQIRICADIHVRRTDKGMSNTEKKFIVVGPAQAGKSTLIGVLSQGMLDDGRGSARLTTFKHKHEIISGRTSTASAFDIFGFSENGKVWDYSRIESAEEMCKRSKYLVTLIDVAGMQRYKKTLIHGLEFTNPDGAIIVIQAGQVQQHLAEYQELCKRVGVDVSAVVVTEIGQQRPTSATVVLDKSSPKRSRSVPHDILRDIDVPVIWCDCVSGKGLDELRSTVYQIFKNDEAAMMGTGQETQNTIFKVEETYRITDVGTVVTGYLKQGTIKENDILTLGPIEFDEDPLPPTFLDTSMADSIESMNTSSNIGGNSPVQSSPIVISKKSNRKRKRHSFSEADRQNLSASMPTLPTSGAGSGSTTGSSSSGELDSHPASPSNGQIRDANSQDRASLRGFNSRKVRVISVQRHRIRCCQAVQGQLCSLCIEPLPHQADLEESVGDYIINRGAMIYSAEVVPTLRFADKIKVRLKDPSLGIAIKRRTRLNGFYDTACFDASVRSLSENKTVIELHIEKFLLLRIGDNVLLSCLRNVIDVTQAEIIEVL